MIHPTAIIDPEVVIGKNVKIGPYSVIRGRVSIGDGTIISSHVSIGDLPEHGTEKFDFKGAGTGSIDIGRNVVIREFVTVNAPMADMTLIEDNVYVMAHSHVSHDNHLEKDVILSTGVHLGGWSIIQRGANIGLCAVTHQYTTIGAYAMIAANAMVTKDIPPLAKFIPGKPLSLNEHAVKKFNLHPDYSNIRSESYKTILYHWMSDRRDRPAILWS